MKTIQHANENKINVQKDNTFTCRRKKKTADENKIHLHTKTKLNLRMTNNIHMQTKNKFTCRQTQHPPTYEKKNTLSDEKKKSYADEKKK